MNALRNFRRFVSFGGIYDLVLGTGVLIGWPFARTLLMRQETLDSMSPDESGFLFFLILFLASVLWLVGIWLLLAARWLECAPRLALAIVIGNGAERALLGLTTLWLGLGGLTLLGALADLAIAAGYLAFGLRARPQISPLIRAESGERSRGGTES